MHFLVINSTPRVREQLAQTPWFKSLERAYARHGPVSAAAAQVLVDSALLFGCALVLPNLDLREKLTCAP